MLELGIRCGCKSQTSLVCPQDSASYTTCCYAGALTHMLAACGRVFEYKPTSHMFVYSADMIVFIGALLQVLFIIFITYKLYRSPWIWQVMSKYALEEGTVRTGILRRHGYVIQSYVEDSTGQILKVEY